MLELFCLENFCECAGVSQVLHTLIEDHAIVSDTIIKQWENLLPEEEQVVMGQTIANLLHDMFQLDPRLISNCYGGEKFSHCFIIVSLTIA